LDGDLGGKQMGLRSRRSSTATLKTINTVNGGGDGGPQSPRESIAEVEEEEEDNQAGILEMGTKQGEGRRMRLNPKASNSWLRWNSPTTSFPKGKGKGNEVAGDVTPVNRASTSGDGEGGSQDATENVPPNDDDDRATTVQTGLAPAIEREATTEPTEATEATIGASQAAKGTVPPPSGPTAKGWFTKNPPPAPPPTAIENVPEAPAVSDPPPTTVTDEPVRQIEATSEVEQPPASDNDQINPTESPGGWKEYLTWGRKGASRPPIPNIPQVPQTEAAPATYNHNEELAPLPPVEPTVQNQEQEAEVQEVEVQEPAGDRDTVRNSSNHALPRKTWGSFLYGIVIPQVGSTSSVAVENTDTSKSVIPTSATTEQPPVHIDSDPTAEINDTNTEGPSKVLVPVEDAKLKPPTATAPRRSSQASTTGGWLNYLAFRASQKKIENPASSIDSTQEVMESNDPNFPADTQPDTQVVKAANDSKPNTKTSMPPPSGLPDKKKKRLSTSSIKSATSVVPIPPSPQNQSKGGTAASTPAPSTKISSLPPPPQVPTTQPNLVIPSFSTTFDRPPRSFLPPKPVFPTPQPQPGLAWRALGAVGSYVYPGQEKMEEKVDVGPKETRGLKEGREIGTDLPRRIGLGGEDPDDGWKNVKRVVVVGVHGWFPAKIVNS
jgi:hypothetical protein